jgi:alpha-L-fucosidase
MLTDIVSKNGNLMLNIPLRGDGSIDEKEEAFIAGFTAWMDINSEGIFATRRWKVYGEGPSTTAPPPHPYGPPGPPYTAEDIRFTQKGDAVYAFVGAWPESRIVKIKSLGTGSAFSGGAKATNISLLGYGGKLSWTQDEQALSVNLPETSPGQHAATLKINGLPTA